MHTTEQLREVAERAARTAGAELRHVFRGEMSVDSKRDLHDLVTEHDRAAEQTILQVLRDESEEWTVIGEEYGEQGPASDTVWYVDPIDGTSNFAQGIAFFCVSVGVEVAGELAAGAVFDPMADLMFSADEHGAYLDGRPLRTPQARPHGHGNLITGYPTARDLEVEGPAALADLGRCIEAFSSVRRTGSGALTIAHVAAGWTDIALGTSVSPWDVAAAALVLERAGGRYEPLWFGRDPGDSPAHLAPGFVARSPGAEYPVFERVVDGIRERRAS